MEILQLRGNHLEEVVSLWNQAIKAQGQGYQDYELSRQRLLSIMEDENYLPSGALVAVSNSTLTGFVLGYVQKVDFRGEGDPKAKPGWIAGLAVRPDRWHQGVGSALMEKVEAALQKSGKSSTGFQTYRMPISLVHGIYVDSDPYRFLLSRGYRPLGHELRLRNDLSTFRLREDIQKRLEELAAEGIIYRWYEPADRDRLLEFMSIHFSGGWHTAIQRATARKLPARILLALNQQASQPNPAEDRIVGFMGPFYTGEPGQRGGFGSPGVHPDFRRRGIGTVLFHLGLDYLKSAGVGYAEYGTGVTNPARFMYFGSGAQLVRVYCCNFLKKL